MTTAARSGATARIETAVERVADALTRPPAGESDGPSQPAGAGRRTAPPMSLEGGAGTALFLAALARRDPDRRAAAHAQLIVAARALASTASAGLQHGPAAVLAAAQAAARPGGRYPQLLRTLTAHVAAEQLARLAAEPADCGEPGVSWSSYDLITGPTGTGRLLLAAVTEGDAEERAAAEPALRATLAHLGRLSLPVRVDGHRLPGWWVPGHRQPTGPDRARFPRGDVNLGTAHGITGPLALLARSAELGVTVDGQQAAIRRIAAWLAERAERDAFGPYWTPRLPFEEEIARAAGDGPAPAVAAAEGAATAGVAGGAWCFGSIGIAGSLLRAARVSGEQAWQRLALDSVHATLTRPGTLEHLKGPTVCHGEAGYLQSLWRLGQQEKDQVLLDHCARLADRLAAAWDEEADYGYRHLTPDRRDPGRAAGGPLTAEDNTGLLEGAAGVAAALLATLPGGERGGPEAGEPCWDRILLLS
ncbi:lanthionine synthetase C family protein [Kitasatospora sp. NPDC008050]|uniref:lanthionine synthetase C family protein n=1 Tax=Kitasatospora sp. NPDC008050 TaxID=3364021 RepID=UPI0036E0A4FE